MLSKIRTYLQKRPMLRIVAGAVLFAFAALAILIVAGVIPAYQQVCEVTQGGEEYCASHFVASIVIVNVANFLDTHNWIVLAVATIAIAWFTLSLKDSSDQQGKLTKEALVVSRRAFIFLEDFEQELATRFRNPSPRADRLTEPDIGGFTVMPRWRNSGDTPPRNLTLQVATRIVVGDLPDDFDYPFEGTPMRAMIGPRAKEYSAAIEIPEADANRVLAGNDRLYIWGRADYQDVFGYTRFTQFCSRVEFVRDDREINARYTLYGPYNRTELDEV